MSDRFDILRSWIRAAADQAVDRVAGTRLASATRRAVERLTHQLWRLSDDALTSAAAHAEGVDSAMVACRRGRIFVDASLSSGREVQFSLAPLGVRFAPRGAKEISFDVQPPGAFDHSIVGAIAACIARATWPMILPQGTRAIGSAIVETESAERIRVDLRTVPAVRRFAAHGTAALIFDVLELESIRVEQGALALKLKLPHAAP